MTNGILGHGYEGKLIEPYLDEIKAWGAATLVDVRLNPLSRKKGFSKRGLAAALEENGMEYMHMPELGNLKDNREGFSEPGTEAANLAHARYREVLTSDKAVWAIDTLAERASRELIVLLCFEASERCCHRSLIIEAVKTRMEQLVSA